MILRVGPFLYRVKFVEGYIHHEGEDCLGLCDNDAHELLVSTVTGEAQQIQVICHEYMEAWLYHFGANISDKEDYCDLFGMAMTQFVLDLTRQLHLLAAETDSGQPAPDASDKSTTAQAMLQCLGQAAYAAPMPEADAAGNHAAKMPLPPQRVATKLARHAARVGLRIRDVYDGE